MKIKNNILAKRFAQLLFGMLLITNFCAMAQRVRNTDPILIEAPDPVVAAPPQPNLSVGGKLETVFDRFGKKYSLSDIRKPTISNNATVRATLISCSSTSIFNLYFEEGSGMESPTSPLHIARRAVVCKVFEDISNFLNTPLTTTGNKVNIWVRNINNISTSSSGFLGFASSFYNVPYSTTTGGIEDSEVWKTITLGVDSYANVAAPLVTIGTNSNASGIFIMVW